MIKQNSSFTLVEVLVGFLILTIGLMGAMGVYNQMQQSTGKANLMSIATSDLSAVMETLRTMNASAIQAENANATLWSSVLSDQLANETVSLQEINNDWTERPLRIRATLQWREHGVDKSISMFSVFSDE